MKRSIIQTFWRQQVLLVISQYYQQPIFELSKGQLISKFQRKYFWIPALKFFVAFWGLPVCFLGFQQPSLFIILLSPQEAQKASRCTQEATKKFQGRIPEIFALVFWMKLIFHNDILKLTDQKTKILCNNVVSRRFGKPSF